MKKKSFTVIVILLAAAIVITFAMLIAKMSGRPRAQDEMPSSSQQEPVASQPGPSSMPPDMQSKQAPTPEPVEIIMTQKELNEYINESGLAQELAKEVEIVLRDDGKFELSGKVDLTTVSGSDKLPGALAMLPKSMLKNLPVSANGSAALNSSNQLDVSIKELKVGGFTLPDSLAGEISSHMENEISSAITELADFSLTSFEISEGRLYLKGETK